MIKIAQVIHQIYACTRKFNKSQWFDFSIFSLSNREMMFVGWSKKQLSRIRWSNREICNLCAIHWVNVACNGMLTIGDGGRRQVSRPAQSRHRDHCARQWESIQGSQTSYVHRPYIGQSRPKAASDPWKRWWGMNMNMPAAAAGFTGRVSVAGVTLMATI